jgi:CxxC motif-containing protein (DUF1111 family)
MTARAAPRLVLPLAAVILAAASAVGVSGWQAASVPRAGGTPSQPAQAFEPMVRSDLSAKDLRRVTAVTRPTKDFSRPEPFEAMAGGAGTSVAQADRNALTHPHTRLDDDGQDRFRLGSALFEKLWVSSPSSTQASDGLGPLYNARSCETCHVRDGRGRPPEGGTSSPSLVLKLVQSGGPSSLAAGDPVYGHQLQDSGVPGLAAEGQVKARYDLEPVRFADGEIVTLRRPTYGIDGLAYGPLDGATQLSPRLAPPMTGLGLLEAIDPADILAHADAHDRDGDGISGRPSWLGDRTEGAPVLGRFGWKAQAATVRAQAASAFAVDLGISTPDVMTSHGDCTARQPACLAMEDGVQPRLGNSEAPDPVLDLVAFYARHLAVPARRNVGSSQVLSGKQLFSQAACAACHVPKYVTSRDASSAADAFQLIWPYTDLLLHDMGDGLADADPADAAPAVALSDKAAATAPATAKEWRTPPLWGIGLARTVDARAGYLHDGRARTLTEAILWHGGEAQAARNRFVSLDAADRQALIAFLESL